jgi:hypothetical protein
VLFLSWERQGMKMWGLSLFISTFLGRDFQIRKAPYLRERCSRSVALCLPFKMKRQMRGEFTHCLVRLKRKKSQSIQLRALLRSNLVYWYLSDSTLWPSIEQHRLLQMIVKLMISRLGCEILRTEATMVFLRLSLARSGWNLRSFFQSKINLYM